MKIDEMQHKVGDDIYIQGAMYMGHGKDDFAGGLCKISEIRMGVSAGERVPFVEVEERPGYQYNYLTLLDKQDKMRETYGTQRGHADPDLRPEFNEGW
jgi:hypothetical protein